MSQENKREILAKHVTDIPEAAEPFLFAALDEYAKQVVNDFGEWRLSEQLRYERGENPDYGKLSYFQLVDKFFKQRLP